VIIKYSQVIIGLLSMGMLVLCASTATDEPPLQFIISEDWRCAPRARCSRSSSRSSQSYVTLANLHENRSLLDLRSLKLAGISKFYNELLAWFSNQLRDQPNIISRTFELEIEVGIESSFSDVLSLVSIQMKGRSRYLVLRGRTEANEEN